MVASAAERGGGTQPYLTVPSQRREARVALGEGKPVAPEQTVVLDEDAASARRSARDFLRNYLRLVNYTDNMLRAGLPEADIAGEGSDELVDRLVVTGAARAEERRGGEGRVRTCQSWGAACP